MLVFVTICSFLSFKLSQNEREYRQAQPTAEPKADQHEQSIHLVEWCESWLASGNPALEVIMRSLRGTPTDALFVSDQALLDTQLARAGRAVSHARIHQ